MILEEAMLNACRKAESVVKSSGVLHCPFCGKPDPAWHPIHGHYETTCCHQTLANCCEGPVSALP